MLECLEQHLSEDGVLDLLRSSLLVGHQGKLEAPWVADSGHGNVQLTVGKGLRPHPESHMAQSLT